MAGPSWIIEKGAILRLDPLKEANWVAAGHASYVTEHAADLLQAACPDEQPKERQGITITVTVNGQKVEMSEDEYDQLSEEEKAALIEQELKEINASQI
jgi:hypothetical protein